MWACKRGREEPQRQQWMADERWARVGRQGLHLKGQGDG